MELFTDLPTAILCTFLFFGVPFLFIWDLGIVVCLIVDLIRSKKGHSVHILGAGLATVLLALGFAWDSLGPFREHGSFKYIPIQLVIGICTVPILHFVYYLYRCKPTWSTSTKHFMELVFYGLVALYSIGAISVWSTSTWQ